MPSLYEALLACGTQRGRFSYGDAPTLADVYLIPQIESVRRFGWISPSGR